MLYRTPKRKKRHRSRFHSYRSQQEVLKYLQERFLKTLHRYEGLAGDLGWIVLYFRNGSVIRKNLNSTRNTDCYRQIAMFATTNIL